MDFSLKNIDPAANKPVYLCIANAPHIKEKVEFFRVHKLIKNDNFVNITGHELSKAQVEKIKENPKNKAVDGPEINMDIPWVNIIRIINLTHKISAKEKEINE